MIRPLLGLLLSFLTVESLLCQDFIQHRYNLRTRQDGRYLGLFFGGGQGFRERGEGKSGWRFFPQEQSLRDLSRQALRVEKEWWVPLGAEGHPVNPRAPFPWYRQIPAPWPAGEPARAGLRWEAPGSWVWPESGADEGDPVSVLVAYEMLGQIEWFGQRVWEIRGQFALRDRRQGWEGRHVLRILWGSSGPIFMSDTVDQVRLSQGQRVEQSGFIQTWFEGLPEWTPEDLAPLLRRGLAQVPPSPPSPGPVAPGASGPGTPTAEASTGGEPGPAPWSLESTEEGLKLTLPDLFFVADQARLLPGEEAKLERLAALLKPLEGLRFRVEGHTADVGTRESQNRLSEQRAQAIVEALVSRGLPADRFLYRGYGGSRPVAENSSPEGRAANRRVEILIWRPQAARGVN